METTHPPPPGALSDAHHRSESPSRKHDTSFVGALWAVAIVFAVLFWYGLTWLLPRFFGFDHEDAPNESKTAAL
jgi:uncharacterized membrane protein